MLVLYGLGTTIGVGIYALLGEIAGVAGAFAPWSFLVAAALAGLTALSFAELANRFPQSAATALYIERGFHSPRVGTVVGLLLTSAAVASAATLGNGLVGYTQVFVPIPNFVIVTCTLLAMGGLAAWGIKQSAWFAAATCLLEIAGVLWIIALSMGAIELETIELSGITTPGLDSVGAVFAGAVLSFYAYIGFEDMVEVAEEVRDVRRTLPTSILLTLAITAFLYIILMLSAQLAVGTDLLTGSDAPFADIYQHLTGQDPIVLAGIGVLAMLNGMLIQLIMSSRILYGLACRNQIPRVFGRVSTKRGVPAVATWTVTGLAVTLALIGTIGGLATLTSIMTLIVFSLTNFALHRIKARADPDDNDDNAFRVWRVVPMLGAVSSAAFALAAAATTWSS